MDIPLSVSRYISVALAAALLTLPAPALASVTASAAFPAAAAASPPPPDPSIPAAAWQKGAIPESGGFMNLTTRAAAPHATQVWMMYDARNLYVAFHAEQRGTPIVATQTTNDVGFGTDDFVGVGIDTSGSGSQIYYFETTPRGVRYQQAEENVRYRPTWQAFTATASDGWNAVMIIPLDVMRLHGGTQTWHINFIRNVAASAEHYTWAYDGVMQDGSIPNGWPNYPDARFWPSWTGLTTSSTAAVKPKPRLEIYTLDSIGRDRNLFQQANGAFLDQKIRNVGLDATYPLTNTINFVGTVNPDFSNVEIDQQTIAPQEFRRFLQEYRPFFTQGANFINTNADNATSGLLFYSPSVGPFDRGEKIEGTYGAHQAFGILNFRGYDQTGGNTFDDTAFGYQHALQNRTFIYWVDGVLAHHSNTAADSSFEFGTKGRNLHSGLVWAANHATEVNRLLPGGAAHNSDAFIDVHKPNYELFVGYNDITPFFSPIDGIISNSDIHGFSYSGNASGSMKGVKNFFAGFFSDRYLDRSGAVHQADFGMFLNATFKNGFSLNGLGGNISELRSYAVVDPAALHMSCNDRLLPRSYFSGFPSYFCGRTDTFNLVNIPIGYRDGTPTPIDASVNFGQFGFGLLGRNDNGPDYLHLYTLSTSRPLGRVLSLGLEYDGSFIRARTTGAFDSQWLRRISIGALLGPNENLTLSLRTINGRGGFSAPGTNLAAAYHRRFRNGDELFLNFGTPAAPQTLDRFIAKYLFRFGGDAGT